MAMREYDPTGILLQTSAPRFDATEDLSQALATVLEEHRPSRMPFFSPAG